MQHGNDAVSKKCNMKRLQHEKSATCKNINFHSEIRKKCIRIVHKRTTGRPLTDRYTLILHIYFFNALMFIFVFTFKTFCIDLLHICF